MSAELNSPAKWQRPLFWALLIAVIFHLLILYSLDPPKEVSIEQRFSEATEVTLYDVKQPAAEPEEPLEEVEPTQQVQPLIEAATPPKEEEQPTSTEEAELADEAPPPEQEAIRPQVSKSLISRSLEIARLEAELAAMQTSYAQQTRVRRISSGAKMSSEEALYLKQWEQKVERIGNLNYPEEARKQNLGGRLRLMVVIAADGRILEAQLLTSSGHSLLDDAAVRILNLAAPFAPLPESIKADADVLEIIRTWQFGDGWYAN
ncbi:energy transducer TonB [Marinospirillum insulare]|uniref:Transporter TonB n=1 Tax=Marinospirillum insulare TaxID=217169 RepID=A0ABQ6A3W0_9GAMM|nr:energy transducer TonB [Marinospirillum insulare]GLR64878.1 transporter TonB [Marinospirillum insulare]